MSSCQYLKLFIKFFNKFFNYFFIIIIIIIIIIFKKIINIISKYCPVSNSNANTALPDMNNIESSTDFESSNEVYNISNN